MARLNRPREGVLVRRGQFGRFTVFELKTDAL
jgi:hypothetical protein